MSQLPSEILLEIFQWVLNPHACIKPRHIPFQTLSVVSDQRDRIALKMGKNISLVCRQWRQLIAELLYRDIRILHGTKGLEEVLQTRTTNGNCYGDWVQRAVLPFSSTITGPSESSTCRASIDILKLCPNLRILVRPQHLASQELQFHYEAQSIPLPSLERLEWWHNNEAERTGGINSLTAVLYAAPSLIYLFIGGLAGYTRIVSRPISLPNLKTLRLRSVDGLLLRQIVHSWALPALTQIVLDAPGLSPQNLSMIWHKFGQQLRTVELGKNLRFLLNDAVSPCLRECPGLKEMNYFALFTLATELSSPHYSLQTVGLHCAVNSILAEPESAWSFLEHHFNMLLGQQLAVLQRIVLHGDWRGVVAHPRFEPILQRSHRIGRFIVYPDGTTVSNQLH
ncbi:hypothetical protein APHAL10511_005933 [Amanita phalloides]|nr:hypothetical protein APHAL10511_005933 [Amanita phalloides]